MRAGPAPRRVARALLFALALLAGCASTRSSVRSDGRLVVNSNVPDARIYVDDVLWGRAAELRGRAMAVPSGDRRVELRADGWFTAYRDVVVPRAGRASVTVTLRPVPATETGE